MHLNQVIVAVQVLPRIEKPRVELSVSGGFYHLPCRALHCSTPYVRQGEELLAKVAFSAEHEVHFAALALIFRSFIQRISS